MAFTTMTLRLEMMVTVHQEMGEAVNVPSKLTICETSVLNQVSEHQTEEMESGMVTLLQNNVMMAITLTMMDAVLPELLKIIIIVTIHLALMYEYQHTFHLLSV